MRLTAPALLLAGALLAGCAGVPPSPMVALEGHEGAHGPPWAPDEPPWVAPPVLVADQAPYWGGWHGPGIYAGFVGVGRFGHVHRGGITRGHAGARSSSGRRGGRR
jgi:hypothetical protein